MVFPPRARPANMLYACLLMVSFLLVKSLSDAVGASKAPHARNLGRPGVQRVSERDQLRQSGMAQVNDGGQEARDQLPALLARSVLLQEYGAEPVGRTEPLRALAERVKEAGWARSAAKVGR